MTTPNTQNYQQIANNQASLEQSVRQLKRKLDVLGTLKKFDQSAQELASFARKNKIKKSDVLDDD